MTVSPTTKMIEGWYIFYIKGGTHSSVLSTKTSLYDIRSPRYKQNKMGYQIKKIVRYLTIYCFKIWCSILFCLYFGSLMLYWNGFDLKTCLRMSPLKWDMPQPSEMFIAREIKHESRWYQISRLFIISNSWNLIPHIVLLISWLPEIIQKCFCTPDRAMDPTFQMNQPSSMFLAGETVSSEWFSKVQVFFSTPFIIRGECHANKKHS